MYENIQRFKKEFNDITDVVIKNIKVNHFESFCLAYLETLANQDKINNFILKSTNNIKSLKKIINTIPSSNIKKLKVYDECEYYLHSGFTLLFIKKDIYAVETRADINRSIPEVENEPSLKGPKCAFVENYQTNLGLIKKRIKSHKLKVKSLNVGRLSTTTVGVLSIEGIVKENLLNNVYEKLKKIDIDLLNDIETLSEYLSNKSVFPTIQTTERPDKCADALANGKIVIICDDSPSALILPSFLTDFINPYSDKYNKKANINFTKIIRMLCFCFSLGLPAFYIAIVNYNQETIPTSLIINFASQRESVPFPAIIECIIMLIICEILKESDLRYPTKYGAATSILGAIVLGDAAVTAGLISPIMIIIIAFTYISSLIFTELELSNAIRYYRLLFLVLSAILGLYGLLIGIIFLIIKLSSTYSENMAYTFPLSPFDKAYFKETMLSFKNKKRSSLLSSNIHKEK